MDVSSGIIVVVFPRTNDTDTVLEFKYWLDENLNPSEESEVSLVVDNESSAIDALIIVAIVIGILIVIAAIFSLIVFFFRKHKHKITIYKKEKEKEME